VFHVETPQRHQYFHEHTREKRGTKRKKEKKRGKKRKKEEKREKKRKKEKKREKKTMPP
jgi:hypothetical protein